MFLPALHRSQCFPILGQEADQTPHNRSHGANSPFEKNAIEKITCDADVVRSFFQYLLCLNSGFHVLSILHQTGNVHKTGIDNIESRVFSCFQGGVEDIDVHWLPSFYGDAPPDRLSMKLSNLRYLAEKCRWHLFPR